jgi:hypothetical protein
MTAAPLRWIESCRRIVDQRRRVMASAMIDQRVLSEGDLLHLQLLLATLILSVENRVLNAVDGFDDARAGGGEVTSDALVLLTAARETDQMAMLKTVVDVLPVCWQSAGGCSDIETGRATLDEQVRIEPSKQKQRCSALADASSTDAISLDRADSRVTFTRARASAVSSTAASFSFDDVLELGCMSTAGEEKAAADEFPRLRCGWAAGVREESGCVDDMPSEEGQLMRCGVVSCGSLARSAGGARLKKMPAERREHAGGVRNQRSRVCD